MQLLEDIGPWLGQAARLRRLEPPPVPERGVGDRLRSRAGVRDGRPTPGRANLVPSTCRPAIRIRRGGPFGLRLEEVTAEPAPKAAARVGRSSRPAPANTIHRD